MSPYIHGHHASPLIRRRPPAVRHQAARRPALLPAPHALAAGPLRCLLPAPRTPRAATETATVTAVQEAPPVPVHDDAGSASEGPAPGGSTAEPGAFTSLAEPFVWTRHWWPLFPVSCLRPDRPNAVTLLGVPLVAWRDGGGAWRVFRDACPHRLAPLSEGRVEADGSLACSYHGWRFGGSGACSRIPQALDPGAEAAACGSRRACATAYPAQVTAGMLWVWPDDAPDAAAAAAAVEPQLTSGLRGRPAAPGWFARELPYSYEVLVENLLDPAHLPFSHHGVTPVLQRSLGGPMPMKAPKPASPSESPPAPPAAAATAATGPPAAGAPPSDTASPPAPALPRHWSRPSGPDVELEFVGNISPDATISFTAPHLITYTYRLPAGGELNIELIATPVAPGRSRFFSPDPAPPAPGAKRPPLPPLHKLGLKRALNLAIMIADPLVSSHRNLNTILDGDSVFLHVQDELIRRVEAEADASAAVAAASAEQPAPADGTAASGGGGGNLWSRAYYLPTQADSAVLEARRWLEERAGGGPFRARARALLGRHQQPGGGGGGSAAAGGAAHASGVPGAAPSPADRVRLLDRYEQHTRHCPPCRTRLEQLQRLAAAARAVRAAALLGLCVAGGALGALAAVQSATAAAAPTAAAAVAAVVMGWPAALVAACAVLVAAAAGVARVATSWAQQFLFMDYVHADKE